MGVLVSYKWDETDVRAAFADTHKALAARIDRALTERSRTGTPPRHGETAVGRAPGAVAPGGTADRSVNASSSGVAEQGVTVPAPSRTAIRDGGEGATRLLLSASAPLPVRRRLRVHFSDAPFGRALTERGCDQGRLLAPATRSRSVSARADQRVGFVTWLVFAAVLFELGYRIVW